MPEIIDIVQVYGGDGVKPFVYEDEYSISPFVLCGNLPAFGALRDKRMTKMSKQQFIIKVRVPENKEAELKAVPRDHRFTEFEVRDPNGPDLHVFLDAKITVCQPDDDLIWLDIHCNGYERVVAYTDDQESLYVPPQ